MFFTEIEIEEYKRYFNKYNFYSFLQNKNVLITGCKGMTGQAILKWLCLLNEKGCNITIVASTRNPLDIPEYCDESDKIIFIKSGEENLLKSHVDYIIHCASPTQRNDFIDSPVETIDTIVNGTNRILELAKKDNSRVIFLSSCEIYGAIDSENPVNEQTVGAIDSLNIRSSYPLSKKLAELLCYSYFKEYNVDVMIVRISAILGLFQSYDSQRVESEIIRCVIENKNLIMKTDGLTKKSFVYTLDVVAGILKILEKGVTGECYNLTNNDTFLSIKDMAKVVFETFNPKCTIEYVTGEGTTNGFLKHLSYTQDCSKLIHLGWQPITQIKEIFADEIKRFKKE